MNRESVSKTTVGSTTVLLELEFSRTSPYGVFVITVDSKEIARVHTKRAAVRAYNRAISEVRLEAAERFAGSSAIVEYGEYIVRPKGKSSLGWRAISKHSGRQLGHVTYSRNKGVWFWAVKPGASGQTRSAPEAWSTWLASLKRIHGKT